MADQKQKERIEHLFTEISNIFDYRISPDNFRSRFKQVGSVKGISHKSKTEMIFAILGCLVKLHNNEK